ncbi:MULTISPECIES: hypothetical protein [unclassified Nocardia]|uniref:hypothetical protein n=1 Tax=unclassified Nocardia TaxID=2637762 RepID=UPI001CE4A8C7|nr:MULTISPECIES: hypothetical protein [unclassified Nocardia]
MDLRVVIGHRDTVTDPAPRAIPPVTVPQPFEELIYGRLLLAYNMPPGRAREELITTLSLQLIVLDARPDPHDPAAIRWVIVDWSGDGLVPMKLLDSLGHPVDDNDIDLGRIATWTTNLREPELAGLVGPENGPLTLDLHAVHPIVGGER